MVKFLNNWRFYTVLVIPLALLPLVFLGETEDDSKKFKCAYTIILMGVFWMVEAMPLAITSLLPVIFFPFLGVQSTAQVVSNYMRETSMMFIGAISIALAIQYSELHKRIALKIMLLIGYSPRRILLGILVTTFLLSCVVVVNTAVAAMMTAIVTGLVDSMSDKESEKKKDLKKLYMLAVGYAANLGGTATIIGSQPNLIYKELIAQEKGEAFSDLNFITFLGYSMPIAIINLFLTWTVLGCLFLGLPSFSKKSELKRNSLQLENGTKNDEEVGEETVTSSAENMKNALKTKYNEMGNVTFHEKCVLVLLTIAVLLWLTRDPKVFDGWFNLFPDNYVKIGDSSVAVAILVLMFIIPKDLKYFRGDYSGTPETLLTWQFVHKYFPWNVILLVGGGLAISDGANSSGLSDWLGQELNDLENLSKPVILLLLLIIISCFTEVMSNAATISLITPILISLSRRLEIHPLYLSLPGAIACQYSFMLPTSNPPNAIVFAAGEMQILDMVKSGVLLNFICLAVLYCFNISWGDRVVFHFSDYSTPNATMLNDLN